MSPDPCIIDSVTMNIEVRPDTHVIVSPTARVSVLNGCEGLDGIFLIIATVVAFPACALHKLVGIAARIPIMYALNQLRIFALFSALQFDLDLYHALHGTIAPFAILTIGCLHFSAYVSLSRGPR